MALALGLGYSILFIREICIKFSGIQGPFSIILIRPM